MSAQDDLGPTIPPRWQVYDRARSIGQLAQLAQECAIEGPRMDIPRALDAFDRMRALLWLDQTDVQPAASMPLVSGSEEQ